MHQKRITVWLSFVTIAMIVLAGCAPRAGGGETAKMATQHDLVIDLPAIVIDFNAQGEPSVGNVPVAQLASGDHVRIYAADQFVAAGVVVDDGDSASMVAIPIAAAPTMSTALLADTVTIALTPNP